MDIFVRFLNGNFPLTNEFQGFGMAIQGSMVVRDGANKNGDLHWFHAFCLSVVNGFGGGLFGFMWMGRPSSMITNDINIASCILAFMLVNYSPYDIVYKVSSTLPAKLVITSSAQLFRSLGVTRFITFAFNYLKESPSPYYPIPVFGPIFYGTMLGNMGNFVLRGFNGYLQHGMPWPFQNGCVMGTFYLFFAHDENGPIGKLFRLFVPTFGYSNHTFAVAVVGLFMQIVGILQLPEFFGSSFSPFVVAINYITRLYRVMYPTPEQQSLYASKNEEKKKTPVVDTKSDKSQTKKGDVKDENKKEK